MLKASKKTATVVIAREQRDRSNLLSRVIEVDCRATLAMTMMSGRNRGRIKIKD
jgi:hypothetical protein